MKDSKFVMSLITLIVLAVAGFFTWYIPHYSLHSIRATSMCNDIYKEKAPQYFGEEGTNRYLFSPSRNTCLLFNSFSGPAIGETRYVVIDMINDSIIFAFDLPKDASRDTEHRMTNEEALNYIRSLGFIII